MDWYSEISRFFTPWRKHTAVIAGTKARGPANEMNESNMALVCEEFGHINAH